MTLGTRGFLARGRWLTSSAESVFSMPETVRPWSAVGGSRRGRPHVHCGGYRPPLQRELGPPQPPGSLAPGAPFASTPPARPPARRRPPVPTLLASWTVRRRTLCVRLRLPPSVRAPASAPAPLRSTPAHPFFRPPARSRGAGWAHLCLLLLGGWAVGLAGTDPPEVATGLAAPQPLYRDPVVDGAADPVVIWNPHVRRWWMFYTNRRANVPELSGVAWVHGMRLGRAESADGGRTWTHAGSVELDLPPEVGGTAPTHWAPDIVTARDGTHHLFLTVVPGIFEDWQHPRRIVHLTSPDLRRVAHPGRAGTISPQDAHALALRRSSIQVVELHEQAGRLTCERDVPTRIALRPPRAA